MNLLSLFHPAHSQQAARRPAAPASSAGHEAAGRVSGCGWYDSSHDLQTGLQVCEHSDPAELAQALPLAIWLELELQGRLN